MADIRNASRRESATGSQTLRGLLNSDNDKNVVRDSYILFDFPESEGKAFQAGYSVVYPGCRTGGHQHEDVEEVYHIIRGEGMMTVGNEAFRVSSGDTLIVPRFQLHTITNSGNLPIEYFWILIKVR